VPEPYDMAKKQLMENKKLEQQLALDAQNVEFLQKQLAHLESALKDVYRPRIT
jgi:hypothetical protein